MTGTVEVWNQDKLLFAHTCQEVIIDVVVNILSIACHTVQTSALAISINSTLICYYVYRNWRGRSENIAFAYAHFMHSTF